MTWVEVILAGLLVGIAVVLIFGVYRRGHMEGWLRGYTDGWEDRDREAGRE